MNNPNARLRVLHLIETLGSGGAERLLYTNLKHLNRDEVDSVVVTVFDRDQYWRDAIEELGIPIRSLGTRGYRDIPGGVGRLRKVIAQTSPDLIHTHLFAANIIGRVAGRRSGVPVISSIHNPEYEPEASAGASVSVKRKIAAARLADKFTAGYGCSRMIAVSEYVKESAASRLGFPLSKIDLIYNPIDIAAIGDHGQDAASLRRSVELDNDSKLILHVGRLSPQKGFIDAVRAMPAVLEKFQSAHLCSIGAQADERYRSEVADEIESLGLSRSVTLLGERTDVADWLRACDVFVFPSRYEGLGIALTEAMAAGCACVTSNMRPLTEFVTHEVNGLLFTPGDSRQLADAIIGIIGNPAKRASLGQSARSTALEMFDPARAAEQLAKIYFSVRA